mmetsp:Transcript_17276/g.34643  ORF Transcript_17276/g.34643 Transcript_17276/m.34643 type:complete len:140 (-) Transcript_17276:388-807(-)
MAETIMRRVKGKMPARAHDNGIERTPPPTIVAVMLNVAAITVADRSDELEDGTRNVTSAMDVACRRRGTNVGYRFSIGDRVRSAMATASSSRTTGLSHIDDDPDASKGSLFSIVLLLLCRGLCQHYADSEPLSSYYLSL